jgi:hypothetical protein
MFDILIGLFTIGLIGSLIYHYYFRYNDSVSELLNFTIDDLKCIKYKYRGRKYIYLTHKLNDDINTIQKEIDVNSSEKDKLPESEFKYFKILINTEDENNEIILDQPDLFYALIGPVNTYYFAFDTEFNSKLTKFMNYLFFDVKGSLMYGHFSALLEPEKYFTTKTKIDTIQTPCSTIEWIIV